MAARPHVVWESPAFLLNALHTLRSQNSLDPKGETVIKRRMEVASQLTRQLGLPALFLRLADVQAPFLKVPENRPLDFRPLLAKNQFDPDALLATALLAFHKAVQTVKDAFSFRHFHAIPDP
jgi:hypothetical protein